MNVHGIHRTNALVALAAVGFALAVAGPAFAEPSKTCPRAPQSLPELDRLKRPAGRPEDRDADARATARR